MSAHIRPQGPLTVVCHSACQKVTNQSSILSDVSFRDSWHLACHWSERPSVSPLCICTWEIKAKNWVCISLWVNVQFLIYFERHRPEKGCRHLWVHSLPLECTVATRTVNSGLIPPCMDPGHSYMQSPVLDGLSSRCLHQVPPNVGNTKKWFVWKEIVVATNWIDLYKWITELLGFLQLNIWFLFLKRVPQSFHSNFLI